MSREWIKWRDKPFSSDLAHVSPIKIRDTKKAEQLYKAALRDAWMKGPTYRFRLVRSPTWWSRTLIYLGILALAVPWWIGLLWLCGVLR